MIYKIGIIGTGRIAKRFYKEISRLKLASIACIYNPNILSAKRFCDDLAIKEILYTDDLNCLMDRCDIVYIATPHETHYAYIVRAVKNRKHVLCEKPMVLNGNEAESVFELADIEGVILLEAIKTAYAPGYLGILQNVWKGEIGRVLDVEASFSKLETGDVRELQPGISSGSFNELGTYVMLPAMDIFGSKPKKCLFYTYEDENQVDLFTRAELLFEEGISSCKTGLGVKTEGELIISGTKGYIIAKSPWWKTTEFEIRYEDVTRKRVFQFEYEGEGLKYEVNALIKIIEGDRKHYQKLVRRSIMFANIIEQHISTNNTYIIN